MTTLALLIPLTVLLISGMLLRWGWRGIRLDTQPICRRCGFDLLGLPLGVRVCSECGSNLNRRGATRFGNRRRRGWAVMTGAAVLFACSAWIVTCGVILLRSNDPNAYKPVWWLALELDSSDSLVRTKVLSELGKRLNSGTLTQPQIDRLVDKSLRIQRDWNRPWRAEWGQFVEQANVRGLVPAEKHEQYLRQAIESALVLRVRPRVRSGDPIPVEISCRAARIGNATPISFTVAAAIEDTPTTATWQDGTLFVLAPTRFSQRTGQSNWLLAPIDGLTKDRCEIKLSLAVRAGAARVRIGRRLNPIRIPLTAEFIAAEDFDGAITGVTDNAIAQQMKASVKVELERMSGLVLVLQVVQPPQAMSYQVLIRRGNETSDGPFFTCAAGHSEFLIENLRGVPDSGIGEADVILRPCADAAARSVAIDKYWDHELIFENVPVKVTD